MLHRLHQTETGRVGEQNAAYTDTGNPGTGRTPQRRPGVASRGSHLGSRSCSGEAPGGGAEVGAAGGADGKSPAGAGNSCVMRPVSVVTWLANESKSVELDAAEVRRLPTSPATKASAEDKSRLSLISWSA